MVKASIDISLPSEIKQLNQKFRCDEIIISEFIEFFQHQLFEDESFQELFQFAVSTSTLSGNAMLQETIKNKSP